MDQVYDNNHLNTGLNLEKSKLVKVEQEQVMQLNELSTKQQDFHNCSLHTDQIKKTMAVVLLS